MKTRTKLFNFFALLLFLQGCSSSNKYYSGTWICEGENFQNTLVLEKLPEKKNTYKFSFNGWRISYDSFAKQNIKFLGSMSDDVFIVEIADDKAKYSDDGREFDEEFPLYNDGEDRCKLFFEFSDTTIIVKSESCHFIYGGKGVLFDGIYVKQK